MRTLIAYVPVLHEGYRKFFASVGEPKKLYILGPELISTFPVLRKEIRELAPEEMLKAIAALGIFESVELLTLEKAKALNSITQELLLPEEEVSRGLHSEYFPDAQVSYSPIFLRWDKHNALKERPVVPDDYISRDELHRSILGLAQKDSEKSSDNWRHVGAAIARKGAIVLVGHNQHLPSEHTPYSNGDPRNNFHKGEHIELSSAIHAEAGLIAEAAKQGVALEGTDMYVTVFPCPPCAKLVARSGIRNIYCGGGYGVMDGEEILRSAGVKIFFVE